MLGPTIKEYANLLKQNKIIFLVYFVVVSVLFLSMLSPKNIANPDFEIKSFIFIVIAGLFLILYGFKNKDSLHKVSFAVVMFIGLLIAFMAPAFSLHDEAIHLNRITNILDGFLYPQPSVDRAYISFFNNLLFHMKELYAGGNLGINNLLLNNSYALIPISQAPSAVIHGITNSPFYTYLPSVLGVFIAKSLNLSVIYAVWFSRIPSLIIYAIITSYAIKRAPCYKMPLFLVTCTPLATTVMASSNYDCFIFAFFILLMAEFIYMYKNGALKKNILIFFICCLLIGLVKPPYLFFAFLILFIPKNKFNFSYPRLKLVILCILLGIISLFILKNLSTFLFHGASLALSSKATSPIDNIYYLIQHPRVALHIAKNSILFIGDRFILTNYFYHLPFVGEFKGTKVFNILYFVFFIAFSILYPIKIKFSRNKKLALALFSFIFYVGLFYILYASWNAPEAYHIIYNQPRYYVPLFLLMPIIFNYPFKKIKKIDYWTIMGVIVFVIGIFLFTVTHFY